MLYMVELRHSPDRCPGVANDVRDRVLRMAQDLDEVLATHGCTLQGGWVSPSAHLTYLALDAPGAHAVDAAMIDLGLAVWNTCAMYPVLDFAAAIQALVNNPALPA